MLVCVLVRACACASIAFGMRKALMAEQRKAELEAKVPCPALAMRVRLAASRCAGCDPFPLRCCACAAGGVKEGRGPCVACALVCPPQWALGPTLKRFKCARVCVCVA